MSEQEPKKEAPTSDYADKLERALRELEERKTKAGSFKVERSEQDERLRQLEAKLEALPQHERQQVLNTVGPRNVPATPKPASPLRRMDIGTPVEPLRGSSIGKTVEPIRTPRWPLWTSLPRVKLWQAVLLSLNIEPTDTLQKEACGDEPRAHHLFRPRLPQEFFERRKGCLMGLSTDGPIRPSGPLYIGMLRDSACPVTLKEVGAFLVRAGFDIPNEMAIDLSSREQAQAILTQDDDNSRLGSVMAYVVSVQRKHQCRTAKMLFAKLEEETATEDSPFVKGTGGDRGKLVLRDTGGPIAQKTLGNSWPQIRKLANPRN